MTPREVCDVDGCSLTIEPPDPEFDEQIENGAIVSISATMWLATRTQLDELIAKLVSYANELDAAKGKAA